MVRIVSVRLQKPIGEIDTLVTFSQQILWGCVIVTVL